MRIPDLSSIPELRPVPGGEEYDLRISRARDVRNRDNNRDGILLMIEVVGEENVQTIFERIWLPSEQDDEDKKATMWRMIKERITALGLDPADTETKDFEGVEFTAILTEAEDLQGRKINELGRIT